MSIPCEEWENALPSLGFCLKETIRLHIATPMHRINLTGQDVTVGKVVVPNNAIVTYHSSDVHHNPGIYKSPMTWDPSRFLPDRAEDQKESFAFCGWGVGRHPCLGARVSHHPFSGDVRIRY